MKLIVLSFLLTICASIVNSALFTYEVMGTSKSKVFSVSENRIYVDYSNESIVSSSIGVYGISECQGIAEIISGVTTSNVMCKYTEQNGDTNFIQFKSTCVSDASTQGTQTFTFISGTGRWKELVGQKCIGATSSLFTKELGEGIIEDKFMWVGKCEVSDTTLERVKNYKKSQ